jgi:hypothetical protein
MSSDPKKGKKVDSNVDSAKVAVGLKEAPANKEVAGHMSYGGIYLCWACGAANYVPAGWNYFTCWRDGVFNRV